MTHLRNLMVCAAGAMALAAWAQGVSPAPVSVRTVEVKLPSAESGVELTAFWTPPHPASTAAAAVIALHGCDGLPADRALLAYPRNRYVKMFNDAGAGVLYVDSFGSRAEGNLCAQKPAQRSINEANRRLDVIGALQWLAQQPGVDAHRLGVVGWSHGGQTVLASADASADAVRQAPIKPAALVAFYPGCSEFEKAFRYQAMAPMLLMSGELDNWTPAAPCQRLVQRLQGGSQPVRYVQYEGSYHAFDSARPVSERDNAGGTRSGKAMAGGNPFAREASAKEMMQFLGQHLGLKTPMESQSDRAHAAPVPSPTQFGALNDADAVPQISETSRALYREWLTKPLPRAVAISDKGALARGYGRNAMETAIRNCEKFSNPCRLYAVDDQVVWTAP